MYTTKFVIKKNLLLEFENMSKLCIFWSRKQSESFPFLGRKSLASEETEMRASLILSLVITHSRPTNFCIAVR